MYTWLTKFLVRLSSESKKHPAFERLLLLEDISNDTLKCLIENIQLLLEVFLAKIGHSVQIL